MLSILKPKKAGLPFDCAAPLSPEADAFLAAATAEFKTKQEALNHDWRFDQHQHWGFDQESGLLKLGFADGAELHFEGQILGSYSAGQSSWEWAWNNPWVEPAMMRDCQLVKEAGEKLDIDYLRAGLIPLPDGQFVSYLSAIGIKATDSIGAYRGACNPVDIVILLKHPRWARRAAA